jgi:hypothetical protein
MAISPAIDLCNCQISQGSMFQMGVTSHLFGKAAQCLLSPRADATAPSGRLFYLNESITRSIAGCESVLHF